MSTEKWWNDTDIEKQKYSREIIAVCSEIRTEHRNTLSGKNVNF